MSKHERDVEKLKVPFFRSAEKLIAASNKKGSRRWAKMAFSWSLIILCYSCCCYYYHRHTMSIATIINSYSISIMSLRNLITYFLSLFSLLYASQSEKKKIGVSKLILSCENLRVEFVFVWLFFTPRYWRRWRCQKFVSLKSTQLIHALIDWLVSFNSRCFLWRSLLVVLR